VRTCQQWQLFAKVATAGNKATDPYPLPMGQEGQMRQLRGSASIAIMSSRSQVSRFRK
jgi:hypothetical protein